MKKKIKNLFIFLTLISFSFNMNVSALTTSNEINNHFNEIKITLENMKNNHIDDVINDVNYDSLKDTKEIENLINSTIISSKESTEALENMNSYINNANKINNELLNLKDFSLYEAYVEEVKASIFAANESLKIANEKSLEGKESYELSLIKFNELKNLLTKKREQAEKRINDAIKGSETELKILNKHLDEIVKLEKFFQSAYDLSLAEYNEAQKNATIANTKLKEEIEKIKEYIKINGETDLNKLIEANTKMLASGAIYNATLLGIKIIDLQISNTNSKIGELKSDLEEMNKKLEVFKNDVSKNEVIVNEKQTAVNTLQEEINSYGTVKDFEDKIKTANIDLEQIKSDISDFENQKNICSSYLSELQNAIYFNNSKEVVRLLLKNESSLYEGVKVDVEFENQLNQDFTLTRYAKVNEEKMYSYENEKSNVSIYEQELVPSHKISIIDDQASFDKYYAIINGKENKIGSYNSKILGQYIGNFEYKLVYENNKWNAYKMELNCKFLCIYQWTIQPDVSVEVYQKEYYKKVSNSPVATSDKAVSRCNGLNTSLDEYSKNLISKEKEIEELNIKLENAKKMALQLEEKNNELQQAKVNLENAKNNLENASNTITNGNNLTIKQIEEKINELNNSISSKGSIPDYLKGLEIIKNITSGNINIIDLIKDINSLNIGLEFKKELLINVSKIFEGIYNNDKENFKDLVGENYNLISSELQIISGLLKESTVVNAKLLESKIKYEIAAANIKEVKNFKNRFENKIVETNKNLTELKKLKENNNIDFLNKLEKEILETEKNLVTINEKEFSLTINGFVKPEEPEIEKPEIEKPEVLEPQLPEVQDKPINNNNNTVNRVNLNNTLVNEDEKETEEEKSEIKEVTKRKEKNTDKKVELKEKSFLKNFVTTIKDFKLIWIIPLFLIIIIIILILKSINKKDSK